MLNSIRTRLTLWYLGILALIIVFFATATYLLVARNLSRTTDSNLAEIGRSIETDLKKEEADIAAERLVVAQSSVEKEEDEEEEEEGKPKVEPDEAPLTIEAAIAEELGDLRTRDYGFIVLDGNGNTIGSTVTNSPLEAGAKSLAEDTSFADVMVENETFRVHKMRLSLDGKPFRLLITRSLREPTDFLSGLRQIFLVVVPIALALAGLGGYFLARRSLAPVVSMSDQAARIGSTNLNDRLAVRNQTDELGGLANVFNALLSRLESSFNQQKQFMADASHELRTPLAIIRGESEVAISRENRLADEYRESLAIVHDESIRLTGIVEDLFTLARADSGQLRPQFTEIYLDELLADCVRHVRVLAEKKSVSIYLSLNGEMPMQADENLLRQLFLNLLDNAIKYNRDGGTVSITCENYLITIADSGTGIPAEEQPKIFERFFRSDKSRTRGEKTATGGAGLGLSIAQWIADAHGAELKLVKSDDMGSTFAIIFPRR